MSIVICYRDPDSSNEYQTFGPPVEIIDVDYGYADLHDPEEFDGWRESHLETVEELIRQGTPESLEAAAALGNAVSEAIVNYGHEGRKSGTGWRTY